MRIPRVARPATAGAAVVAALALAATGCGSPGSGGSTGSGGGVISIGASVPLSGDYASYGQDYVRGATVAIDQINAAGGVDGHKLTLVAEDDAADPTQAVTVAQKLVSSNVSAVIGPETTSQCLAADGVYARADLATFVAASGVEIAEQGHKNIFQVSYRDSDAGPYDAKTLYDVEHARKVYILTDGSSYAVGLAQAMSTAFKADGGTIVGTGQITAGQNDYSAALARAKASGADHFYYPGYPPEAAKLVKQGTDIGIRSDQWVLGGATFDPTLLQIAGSAANGVIISGTTAPPQLEPAAKQYVAMYQAKFHTAPSVFGQWAYDTIRFLAQVIRHTGYPVSRSAVVSESHALQTFVGVSGSLSFAANGTRKVAPLDRLTVSNGQFVLLSA
jgi:branched-chain amino acid transport system substrate-binding protein